MKHQSDILAFCAPLLWELTYELWHLRQKVKIHCKSTPLLERRHNITTAMYGWITVQMKLIVLH